MTLSMLETISLQNPKNASRRNIRRFDPTANAIKQTIQCFDVIESPKIIFSSQVLALLELQVLGNIGVILRVLPVFRSYKTQTLTITEKIKKYMKNQTKGNQWYLGPNCSTSLMRTRVQIHVKYIAHIFSLQIQNTISRKNYVLQNSAHCEPKNSKCHCW